MPQYKENCGKLNHDIKCSEAENLVSNKEPTKKEDLVQDENTSKKEDLMQINDSKEENLASNEKHVKGRFGARN